VGGFKNTSISWMNFDQKMPAGVFTSPSWELALSAGGKRCCSFVCLIGVGEGTRGTRWHRVVELEYWS
jgi:hypothetical protein